jgi:hypothetical protein
LLKPIFLSFCQCVSPKSLSQQQAQELIVELQRQMMIKDNLYKQLIKQEWGI